MRTPSQAAETDPKLHLSGGTIRTRNRSRILATLGVAALAAGCLTSCSIQGNAAERWLSKSQIIETSDVRLAGCEAMCDPEVEGTISDSATDDQIRRLAEAATEYLAGKGGEVAMSLEYGKVSFEIAPTQEETSLLVGLALAAFTDDRVSFAAVNQSFTLISGPKADLSALYGEYGAPENPPLSLSNDEDDETYFGIKDGADRCETSDSVMAAFDSLLLDPSVISLHLEPCAKLEVTIADESGRDAMIATIQPYASDPDNSSVAFSVDAENGSPFSVTADTPQLAGLFDLFVSTPGVSEYSVTDDVIDLEISDSSLLRSVATTIDAAPRPESTDQIRIGNGRVKIYSNGDGTLEAQLGLAESVLAMGAGSDVMHFSAQPDSLEFRSTLYDSEVGKQVVDAVMASGLWRTSSTEIEVFDRPRVFTVEAAAGSPSMETAWTDEKPASTKSIEELNAYWAAQQRASS